MDTHEDILAHEWFTNDINGINIDDYENQSESLVVPFMPEPLLEGKDELWKNFNIKEGRNVLKETVLKKNEK